MTSQFPAIIIVAPLMTAIVVLLTHWSERKFAFYLAVAGLVACLISSISILVSVIADGSLDYRLGGWAPPWGIEYQIDHLNGVMLVLISILGLLTGIHAKESVERELSEKASLFWSLYLLLITGLLGISITGDLFNLFVLLEVASLAGYALIAMGERGALYASFRYLIIGTIGASFYLLGVGYLYIATGSLNIADLSGILPQMYQSKTVLVGSAFLLIGLGIKMALFPMHGWLPDAYTLAPSAVSATVAPLMTKVMAYVMIRVVFTVFHANFPISILAVTNIMVWVGTLAILFGAVMALSQDNFKRMLSYVIVAEIGYIVGGVGVANSLAMKGAVFHILNDALMVACLFLVAGQIRHQTGGSRIADFTGMFRRMPVTAAVFTVGALAVIGVPPTCGFFSKWYLLLGGIEAHQWGFVAALLVCTLINVALFFRVFDKGIYLHAQTPSPHAAVAVEGGHPGEAPASMVVPAVVLAVVIILVGIFNQLILNQMIRFTIPAGL